MAPLHQGDQGQPVPRRRGMSARARLALIAASLLAIGARAVATDAADREAQLKAGYLLNFAKLIEWPAASSQTVVTYCFIGAATIHDALAAQARSVANRPVSLRQLEAGADVAGCDVLYVDGNVASYERAALPARMHVLTVGDAAAFIQQGGMIQLFTQDNRLRFSINIGNAKQAGLNISSRLLHVAANVERESTR